MDWNTPIPELAVNILKGRREQLATELSERLRLSGSESLLGAHLALFDLAAAHIQERSPRRTLAEFHRILAVAGYRQGARLLISGQMGLWVILQRLIREETKSWENQEFLHRLLALTGETLDGLTGALIAISLSEDSSVMSPGWEALVEVGRTRREFEMLNGIVRELLDVRDAKTAFDILKRGILDTFCLRSLSISIVNHEKGDIEVVDATSWSPITREPIGIGYDLAHPDVLCEVVRTGRMEVVDGWDPRYHERIVQAELKKIAPEGADVVFESTGIPACLDPAIDLCRPHGKFILQGNYGAAPISYHFLPAHGRRLTMFYPCDDGFTPCRRAVLKNMAMWVLPWHHTITHRIEARDAPKLYEAIHKGEGRDVLGAVIRWA